MDREMNRRERENEAQDAFRAFLRCERSGRDPRTQEERAAMVAISVLLCEGRTGAVDAVREIYGANREARGRRGDMESRILAYIADRYLDRATVYRWLRMARDIYFAVRYPRSE